LREEHKSQGCANKFLRKYFTFSLKEKEASDTFKILHNEELRDLCRLPRIVGRFGWTEHVTSDRESWNAYKISARNLFKTKTWDMEEI
jgi:hypothetical protein